MLIAGILLLTVWAIAGGEFTSERSTDVGVLVGAALVMPFILVPLFILSHDLERTLRYEPSQTYRRLRAWAWSLRLIIAIIYILLLNIVAGALWTPLGKQFPEIAPRVYLIYLFYLFAVPFLVTGGLGLVTQVLAWWRQRRVPPALPGA